jgi:CheY-like chemotaxis protein
VPRASFPTRQPAASIGFVFPVSALNSLALIASGLEIDLVLADFAMPEMMGSELATTIHTTHPVIDDQNTRACCVVTSYATI